MVPVVAYDLVVIAIGLALVGVLSVPAIFSTCKRQSHKDSLSSLYEDEDGQATEESSNAYSDVVQRCVILGAAVLGCVLAVVFLTLATLDKKARCISHEFECRDQDNLIWLEQCLVLPSWAFILTQSIILFNTRSTVEKWRLGIYGSVATLALSCSTAAEALCWWAYAHSPPASTLYFILALLQFVLGLILTVTFVLIPRRPAVYRDAHVVDPQYTVSLLSRATFDWATPLLSLAAKKKTLDLADLPKISYDLRSSTLRKSFENAPKHTPFWKNIFRSNRPAFLLSWTLQTCQAFINFAPQIVLLGVLRYLEARDAGEDKKVQLWLLAILLGLADTAQSWLESSLYYVCYNKLGSPVYEQISSIVFAKALRKKDVKGVAQVEADGGATEAPDLMVVNKNAGGKGEDRVVEDEAEDEVAKSKQSTINLIGVDGKRVADFATYNSLLLGSTLKIIFAIVFLVQLIGWVPLMAGLLAFSLLMPVNWWVTTTYTHAQDVLMKVRDSKMAVVSEALQGIRQIKFSALEREWHEKINRTRERELKTQWRVFVFDAALIGVWIFGPVCLSAISLTVYALIHGSISASVAFTTIAIFEAIEVTLAVIPEVLSEAFDALISSRRIQEYLDSADQSHDIVPGEQITFEGATVSWPSDAHDVEDVVFQLRGLNLTFPPGELSVISGKTGSGKSLLLASIVGETEIRQGRVLVPQAPTLAARFDHKANTSNWIMDSAIAYVSQIPWIENATIKDNILFGLPLDSKRYKDVMMASALEKDLEILQDGDMTDIGANGINLSGGQKWRVSFARALYSRAGILILDDIFSAVDAHVGKHLFEEALTGKLGQGRTRILVTHHVSLCLPRTKYTVLLENGTVVQAGLTEDLRRDGLLTKILAYDAEEQRREEEEAIKNEALELDDGGTLKKILSHQSHRNRRVSILSQGSVELTRTRSRVIDEQTRPEPKKFTEEEKRETGAVKYRIYNAYIQACGGYLRWVALLMIFFVNNSIFLGRSYWISVWTRSYQTESEAPVVALFHQATNAVPQLARRLSTVQIDPNLSYYLGVYMAISLAYWVFGTGKYYFTFVISIRASRRLFDRLTYAILRAPLRFLDTTPMGRILNRFTADFNQVDSKLASDLSFCIHTAGTTLTVVIAGIFVSPFMLVAAAILLFICVIYARRFLAGAREIKRLESNAKSPVFEQFGSVLTGIGTIRAFGKADVYLKRMEDKIDTHCQAYFHLWLMMRWMSLRVGLVGSVFLTVMGALVVSIPNIDAPLAGFALSFSLQLSSCIVWMLRQYSSVELDMNAIERIVEYSDMPTEDQGGLDAPAAWPTKGEVEVNDLIVSYAPDLAPVLRGLTFHVKSNERIGVVGRTGAGKSSLTLALFRFLEATSGTIHIDGIDISKIKLYDLRSRLAIIPQDPVLFSGTVRSNLDAFDQLEDAQLRDALVRVHLTSSTSGAQSGAATPHGESSRTIAQANANIFASLSSKISEGGLNLSQGQRQLLCLARAIVSRPKIMVLDEATSSVDMETDALIQRSIREEFADSTLIVIAHRLSTIADFDRILVLGEGQVLEFDSPANLMAKSQGVFRGMVEESGERKELEQIIQRSSTVRGT